MQKDPPLPAGLFKHYWNFYAVLERLNNQMMAIKIRTGNNKGDNAKPTEPMITIANKAKNRATPTSTIPVTAATNKTATNAITPTMQATPKPATPPISSPLIKKLCESKHNIAQQTSAMSMTVAIRRLRVLVFMVWLSFDFCLVPNFKLIRVTLCWRDVDILRNRRLCLKWFAIDGIFWRPEWKLPLCPCV